MNPGLTESQPLDLRLWSLRPEIRSSKRGTGAQRPSPLITVQAIERGELHETAIESSRRDGLISHLKFWNWGYGPCQGQIKSRNKLRVLALRQMETDPSVWMSQLKISETALKPRNFTIKKYLRSFKIWFAYLSHSTVPTSPFIL